MVLPQEMRSFLVQAPQVIAGKSIVALPSATQVTSGGQISIELPQVHGLDTRSCHLVGDVSVAGSGTGAQACCLPRGGVTALFETIQVTANNKQIGGASCPYHNVLTTMLTDWTAGVQDAGKMSVYHGGADVPPVSGNTASTFLGSYDSWGTYTPTPVKAYDDASTSPYTAAQQGALTQGFNNIPSTAGIPANGLPFSCNMLGSFLGTVEPSILPTYLMGRVNVNITLAQPGVLVQGSTASTTPQFKLGNLRLVCNTFNFGDLYEQAQRAYLESGEYMEMPFTSFYAQQGPPSLTFDQQLNFSVGASSIDGLFACFLDYDFRTGYPVNTMTNNSQYFNMGRGDLLRHFQWSINGSRFPTMPVTAHDLYSQNEADLGLMGIGKGLYRNINSSRNWLQGFFAILTRTNMEIAEAPGRVQTGYSSLGQNAQMALITTADQTAVAAYQAATGNMPSTGKPYANYIRNQPIIFIKTTAVMVLGAGASIDVIP